MEKNKAKIIVEGKPKREYTFDAAPFLVTFGSICAGVGNFFPNPGKTNGSRALHSTYLAVGAIVGGLVAHYTMKGVGYLFSKKAAPVDQSQIGNVL